MSNLARKQANVGDRPPLAEAAETAAQAGTHARAEGTAPGISADARGTALRRQSPPATEPPAPENRPRKPGLLVRITRGTLKTLLPLVVIAIGFAGYKYLKATRPETPKRPQAERAFNVTTIPVTRATLQPALQLYGATVAGRQVDIRALVSGRVVETHAELREGGRIDEGATLLAVDTFDYAALLNEAKAQRAETTARLKEQEASLAADKTSLEHAKAQLDLTKADVERAEQLARRGNLPERTLDDRRQLLLQRRQSVDQLANSANVWQARIAQTKLSADRLDVAIARAEKRLAETKLVAPFDAYVTEVGAQVGRMLSSNDKVATLIDRNWIEAQFALTDSQFGRILAREGKLEGRKVTVRWSLGGETFTYAAEITRVAARINATSGGIDVFARIADPTSPVALRPGAFVELELPDVAYQDVVRIPNTALYDGNTVYAVIDSRMDPRTVELVGTAGGDLIVRGDLKDGERIVTTRISTPGKGVLVKDSATKEFVAKEAGSKRAGAP